MPTSPALSEALAERVLTKLGLTHRPEPTLAGLSQLYAAWCQRVPFDNVRKLIHLHQQSTAPFPGTDPVDFLEAWLQHGTGGTCWAGSTALYTLLTSLGFTASRCIATMLVAPDLPPNHGSVCVTFGGDSYLADTSILHGEPLHLESHGTARISHAAWGVSAQQRQGLWHIHWRPLHQTDGFECCINRFDAEHDEYARRYEETRGWSPFNYQLTARLNCGTSVRGATFGEGVTLLADGRVEKAPIRGEDRRRLLIEELHMSEEIVRLLPPDQPTPPPPGSKTAAAV